MPKTLDEIRQSGLRALLRELGRVGMIRFLQQFRAGSGDYAKERREWVDKMSFDDLQVLISAQAGNKKRKTKRG